MKVRILLVAFVVLAIVALIYITRQQREKFEVDPVLAKQLVEPNIRLSNIQRREQKAEDAINAGVGKAAMDGII